MKIDEIRVVLVDDEPRAITMLKFYLEKIPYIKIVEDFTDAGLALEWLLNNKVDLLFTDIDMPVFTGIGLVKALVEPPKVIYCTSHAEFAAESFETRPIDFLTKPIAFDRLQQALGWAVETIQGIKMKEGKVLDPYVFVKELGTKIFVKVKINEIQYVRVDGNDCVIEMLNGKVVTRKSLKELRERLGAADFIMVERAFLVNRHLINVVQEGKVFLEGVEKAIPIGPEYAANLRGFVKSKLW